MRRQLIARGLSVVMGALTVGMTGIGLVMAFMDHNDGSPSTNYGMWTMPMITLIIGLTAAVVLWFLADIDRRLARLEETR